MPVVTCPNCQHEQILPRELDGLIVACGKCRAEFRVREKGGGDRVGSNDGDWVSAILTLWKTVALVGGLVLLVALVIGVFVLVSRSGKNADKDPARQPDPAARWQADERGRQDRVANDRAVEDVTDKAKAAMGVWLIISIVAAVILYASLVLFVGGWVARDAYARGMNGLAWAAFYYLFQLLSRSFVVVVLLFPLALLGWGSIGMLFGEPLYWMGLVAYRYGRRQGRLAKCETCRNPRLDYLPKCPHCGRQV
jgi:uncharacterized membrane protein